MFFASRRVLGQLNALLRRYIEASPMPEHRLVLASYLDGKKHSELGEQLGISESAAVLPLLPAQAEEVASTTRLEGHRIAGSVA